jgi:hypothetical protein
MARRLGAFALVAAFSGIVFAQTPPRPAVGSRIVLATVTDTGNRPLVELGPDDFVVEEAGHPRDVLSLHMADYPVALLLDDTRAAAGDADAIRSAAARFISRVGERAVAVGTLTDPSHLLVPFDSSRGALLDRVRRFTPTDAPTPLPLQAAANMARAVMDTGSPFAAIVILSASTVDRPQGADREFLTPILATGAPVYVVANRSSDATQGADEDVLRALANQTHGQYTPIYSSASYSVALDRLADRLSTEVMIEYLVPGAEPLAGDVRVGVKIPGAHATGLGVSK